jgi:hypothetical protein
MAKMKMKEKTNNGYRKHFITKGWTTGTALKSG